MRTHKLQKHILHFMPLLLIVTCGCTTKLPHLKKTSDGRQTQQQSSQTSMHHAQRVQLKISPSTDKKSVNPTPADTTTLHPLLGNISLNTPPESTVTISATSSANSSENNSKHTIEAWQAIRQVPGMVWTYGFSGVIIGALIAVFVTGYRIIGVCISGGAIATMGCIALIYNQGEIMAYAVTGVVILGAITGMLLLFFHIRKNHATENALEQVVSGCDKFLRDNADPTAAGLFKKAQLSHQEKPTRKKVKDMLGNH